MTDDQDPATYDSSNDPHDSHEGEGDDSAYDGLAVAHLDSDAGQVEVAAHMPEPEHEVVEA